MNGFTVLIRKNIFEGKLVPFREINPDFMETGFISKSIISDEFQAELITNSKFPEDKVLNEDNEFVIGMDGVILNLKQLRQNYTGITLFEVIKKLYQTHGERFINNLKGEFSGFIYHKTEQKWLVFTNITGSKRVFFFQNSDYFIFSSNLKEISFLLRKLDMNPKLDIEASYLVLTSGFMLNEQTLVKNVSRLLPGKYLTFKDNQLTVVEYFNLRNITQTNETKTQIIDHINDLFYEAVRLEFEKDIENNYRHIATLSGGLDSRMTILTAHKLGYVDQLNFTFSQSGYLDEKIAKQIAHDYKHEFIFISLDSGNFLKDVERTVYINDGLVIYSGAAHTFNTLNKINILNYGLIHTGMVGDAVIGSFLSKPYKIPPTIESGVYSKKLLDRIRPFIINLQKQYSNEELYKFYGRGFLGALNGNIYLDIFSQTTSPFLEIDFLSYCYSIPEFLKYKQSIYLDWIKSKHPDFGKYIWEKTGVSPLKSRGLLKYTDLGYFQRMSKKFFDIISGTIKSGMNPVDTWLSENESLKSYIHRYFSDNISYLEENKELFNDCRSLFNTGSSSEKFQVLTLMAGYKLHFTDLNDCENSKGRMDRN